MADEAKVELERELGGELAVLELLTDIALPRSSGGASSDASQSRLSSG